MSAFHVCSVTASHVCAVTYWLTATGSTIRDGAECGQRCYVDRDAWFEANRSFLEDWLRDARDRGDRDGSLRSRLHDFGVAFPAWPALPERVEPWWRTPCAEVAR